MSYEYAQKRRGISAPGKEGGGGVPERSFPNSARLDALKSGAMRPTAADKGHRVELREAMRAKMEQSFGADLSNVKMYESQAVADAGAEAVTQGNEIAFAPGKTDFSSQAGQALLGHELSHVVSQSRGEVTGGGFLADSGLEARADREGAKAARGELINGGEMNGGAFAPLSTASAAPMTGPMQAKKESKQEKNAKKEKARNDMDRLFKISSGHVYNAQVDKKNGENEIPISEDDDNFYKQMLADMSPEMMDELLARKENAVKQVYDVRNNMKGDNKNKLDMEAAMSKEAQDLQVYDFMTQQISFAGSDKTSDLLNNKVEKRAKKNKGTKYQKKEDKVRALTNIAQNPYYKTNEAKEAYSKSSHDNAEILRKRYMGEE